jgi:hypothetical protein
MDFKHLSDLGQMLVSQGQSLLMPVGEKSFSLGHANDCEELTKGFLGRPDLRGLQVLRLKNVK